MVNSNTRTLGIIFPNSYDYFVPELVGLRLMASIPFASRYRLIDFTLSSMVTNGISDVAERFGKYLGLALANVASTVDPEVFVIGGGVSKAGPVILDYIKKYYLKYTFRGCRGAKFVLATLGNDAGMYGSAKLVLEQ